MPTTKELVNAIRKAFTEDEIRQINEALEAEDDNDVEASDDEGLTG